MPDTLSSDTWETLVHRLQNDRVTPFLGAGACHGVLPSGAKLARELAERFGYSFGDPSDLVKVTQYLAVRFDPLRPKELIHERFKAVEPPNFNDPLEPHGLMADLELSVYLTTNYDDFLCRAIAAHPFRNPVRDFCRWHDVLTRAESPLNAEGFSKHPGRPIVYHLHGMSDLTKTPADPIQLSSLVVCEDDYLEFLSSQRELLPPLVAESLENNTCLFIGYGLADWNLRVILKRLKSSLGGMNIAVFPLPGNDEEEQLAAQAYFDKYFGRALEIKVFWGTAAEFCAELRKRLASN